MLTAAICCLIATIIITLLMIFNQKNTGKALLIIEGVLWCGAAFATIMCFYSYLHS